MGCLEVVLIQGGEDAYYQCTTGWQKYIGCLELMRISVTIKIGCLNA